jgi:hypothetical protein
MSSVLRTDLEMQQASSTPLTPEEIADMEAGLRTATVILGAFLFACFLVGLGLRALDADLQSQAKRAQEQIHRYGIEVR